MLCGIGKFRQISAFAHNVAVHRDAIGGRIAEVAFPSGRRDRIELPETLAALGIEGGIEAEVDPGFWTSGLGGTDAVPF